MTEWAKAKNNITGCFFFGPPVHYLSITVLENTQELPLAGHEVAWLQYITDRLAALARTSRLMLIFYVIAVGTSGLSSAYWICSFQPENVDSHLQTSPTPAFASHPDLPPSLVEILSLVVSQNLASIQGISSDLFSNADEYLLFVYCFDYRIHRLGRICISDQQR